MAEADFLLSFPGFLKNILAIQQSSIASESYYNLIVLTFRPAKYLVLEPLVTTGEIGISPVLSYERRGVLRSLARTRATPSWGQPFLNHQLASATFTKTSLGYRDRITFGFEELPFQLEFQAQGRVLKVIGGDWQQEALGDCPPLVEALQCA